MEAMPADGLDLTRLEETQASKRPKPPKMKPKPEGSRDTAVRAGFFLPIIRLLAWNIGHIQYRSYNLYDRFRGRSSPQQKARRLRQLLFWIGNTAPKVGEQVGMRIDLLPIESSLVLLGIDDVQRATMPLREARRRIEIAAGGRIEEVFERFDEKAVSSTTAFCVFRARYQGQEVNIKVRRAGIRHYFAADMAAVGWINWLLERLGVFAPGFHESVSQDLRGLATTRLDLSRHARCQTVFRRMARRNGPKWLTAPKVYPGVSNNTVMVSEVVDGVPIAELERWIKSEDPATLARLHAMNIDPALVGRRVLQSAWWAAFENLFFVSGASVGRIIVGQNSNLVFVDFEDSGMLPANSKRRFREMFERLGADDISGAARDLVQVLSPLPYIDVFDFTKRLETELFQELLALRDDSAEWWERTTLGIWSGVMRVVRANRIRMNLDVLRFMASMLAYDMFAARLTPKLDILREFKIYGRQADRRAAKKLVRGLEKLKPEERAASLVARAGRFSEAMLRLGLWVESTTESPPVSYLALSGKAAYASSQFVRTLARLSAILGIGVVWRVASHWTSGAGVDLVGDVLSVARSTWFGLVACVWCAFSLRRVLYRLDDKGD